MKDLSFFAELSIGDQEKISGGAGNIAQALVVYPGGPIVTQCGDVLKTPDGVLIRDNNCFDDPIVW